MTIAFDRRITQNFNEAIRREWLETNGLGGWASSTITGAHTRRYHGLQEIIPHLEDAGIGTISEIFDADWPHVPRGCIAQAWSVAEILRAYIEDLQD